MTEIRNAYDFWRRISALCEFTKDHLSSTLSSSLNFSDISKIAYENDIKNSARQGIWNIHIKKKNKNGL